MTASRLFLAALFAACCGAPAAAQPTYRLDAQRGLKPRATLTLTDGKVTRSAVRDDSGFRLQFHFRKDGKTLATVEARAETSVALPSTAAGTYTVALELFHPAYKGGNARKGEFKAVSDVLTYRVDAAKKVTVVPPARPEAKPAAKKPA